MKSNTKKTSSSVNLKGTDLAPETIVDYFKKNTSQQATTYTPVKANKIIYLYRFIVFYRRSYPMLDGDYLRAHHQ
jgi:hypothetical protein